MKKEDDGEVPFLFSKEKDLMQEGEYCLTFYWISLGRYRLEGKPFTFMELAHNVDMV